MLYYNIWAELAVLYCNIRAVLAVLYYNIFDWVRESGSASPATGQNRQKGPEAKFILPSVSIPVP